MLKCKSNFLLGIKMKTSIDFVRVCDHSVVVCVGGGVVWHAESGHLYLRVAQPAVRHPRVAQSIVKHRKKSNTEYDLGIGQDK